MTATALVGLGPLSGIAHADALTKAQRDKLSPDEILALMKNVISAFTPASPQTEMFWLSNALLPTVNIRLRCCSTCIDSRAPAETILDLRIGDIFNARVAGNVENPDILGSMEFACKLAGSKVFLSWDIRRAARLRAQLTMPNSAGLLAKIKPAVTATTYTGERTSKNYAFVDAVARKNVEITVADIRKDSPVLAEIKANGAIKIAGAMYNLETGVVDFSTG